MDASSSVDIIMHDKNRKKFKKSLQFHIFFFIHFIRLYVLQNLRITILLSNVQKNFVRKKVSLNTANHLMYVSTMKLKIQIMILKWITMFDKIKLFVLLRTFPQNQNCITKQVNVQIPSKWYKVKKLSY